MSPDQSIFEGNNERRANEGEQQEDSPVWAPGEDSFQTGEIDEVEPEGSEVLEARSPEETSQNPAEPDGASASSIKGASEAEETDETDSLPSPESVSEIPRVNIVAGEMPRMLSQAQDLLRATGHIFTSGGNLVDVVEDSKTRGAVIETISAARLSVVLAELAEWWQLGSKGWGRVDVPDSFCRKMLAQGRLEGLQPLAGLASQPFIRRDGSLCLRAGYDAESTLYGAFSPASFPVPDEPSAEQANKSLNRLFELLSEFPFKEAADASAAIAAIFTATLRPGLNTAPMFLITAPAPGTGKTYLAELISAFASPRPTPLLVFPAEATECEKVLNAALMENPHALLFDNLTSDIPLVGKLCSILTSESGQGRVLGKSKIAHYTTRTVVIATGNNVRPHSDMDRRVVTINLDANTAMPAARDFKHPKLLSEVKALRNQLITDVLTIVRAWQSVGTPRTSAPPMNSFADWSSVCREPLLWLGLPDPATSTFAQVGDDPDHLLLERLVTHWHAQFGGKLTRVYDLDVAATRLGPGNDLHEVLVEISDPSNCINNRRVGKWIQRHVGQHVLGKKLEQVLTLGHSLSWRLVSV